MEGRKFGELGESFVIRLTKFYLQLLPMWLNLSIGQAVLANHLIIWTFTNILAMWYTIKTVATNKIQVIILLYNGQHPVM